MDQPTLKPDLDNIEAIWDRLDEEIAVKNLV